MGAFGRNAAVARTADEILLELLRLSGQDGSSRRDGP